MDPTAQDSASRILHLGSSHNLEQGGFASTVWADEANSITLPNDERNPGQKWSILIEIFDDVSQG